MTELNHSSDPLDPLMSPEVLSVYKAIQIEFGTQAGRSYVLESSRDLKSWRSFGNPFTGVGGLSSISVKTDWKESSYFRLRTTD